MYALTCQYGQTTPRDVRVIAAYATTDDAKSAADLALKEYRAWGRVCRQLWKRYRSNELTREQWCELREESRQQMLTVDPGQFRDTGRPLYRYVEIPFR